jgi:hypothetical protein
LKIHLSSGGHQTGPHSLSQVNAAIADGRIRPAEYMAWHHGCPGWIPLAQVAGVGNAGSLPAGMTAPPPAPVQGDATGGVIPYRNAKALLAYYFGIFGLIPILGVPFAFAAVILGILGLKFAGANPAVRGQVHAWIGIVLGAASLFGYFVVVVLLVVVRSS